jgi:CheY-like chemotaxis protein
MSSKRALVVDDSKSARAFLSRILERHEITVDAAESAEAAIEYLARNKPDVIFMDHLMPGMDGFQAVQTIKNNPRTASIPILMYTSQEGDLYLGQARALGAEGVLPKQIRQADVTRMLFQLRLVSERRTRDQTTFTAMDNVPDMMPANESAIIVQAPVVEPAPAAGQGAAPTHAADALLALLPQMNLEIRAAVDASLQKEIAALRNFIGGTLGAHTERLQGDLAALLPAPRAPELDMPTIIVDRSWSKIAGWSLAVVALAAAAVMSWMWWNRGGEIAALNTDLNAAYTELETLRARAVVSPPAEPAPAPVDANAIVPAADAADAAGASTDVVELVPLIDPPGQIAPTGSTTPATSVARTGAAPVGAAPVGVAPGVAPTGVAPTVVTPAAGAPASRITPQAAAPAASQAQ